MEFAADLASVLGSELVVVHARGMYDHAAGWQRPVDADEALAVVRSWCEVLDGRDVAWRPQIVSGPPIDAVLRVADEVDAGMIVVGSHGAGRSDQPLLGSTSHWIVRNSHRPVVVVPPGDNHPHRRLGGGAGAMNTSVADA